MSFPAIGIGSGVLGFRPYWCPLPFPSLSILGVFHSLLSDVGFQLCFPFALILRWISIVFLLYGRRIATHSVGPSLTHVLGEFPGLGLALVPDDVVPEADSGAHVAENSIQISALAMVEPRTFASSGR